MNKKIKRCALGAAYGILPVLLAWLLVRYLWTVVSLICGLAGLEQAPALQITQAVQQLQEAKLALPWIFGIILAAVCAVAAYFLPKKTKIVLAASLILPLTLGAFCLTVVNDIRVWNLLGAVLPLIKAL